MILPLLLALSGYRIILATSPVRSVLLDSTRKKKSPMPLVLGNYGLIVAGLGVYAVYVAFLKGTGNSY